MEETISLKEIFEVIKKRLWLIIALIVSAALIAAIVSYFILTPTYESESQFVVNQEQQDPSAQFNASDIQTNVELIKTYEVIIKSPAILDPIIEELNLPYSISTLENKISVSSAEQSQVVTITVTDPDPALAADIANTTVQIFQQEIPEILNVDNVKVLSEAKLAADPSPVAPNPKLNIAIAIVLGGMIGVGIAFLLEYLDTTITTETELENHLDLPILGTVTTISDEDLANIQQVNTVRRGVYHDPSQTKTS